MHKIWTNGDKEYVVRNERDEFVLGPFTSWDTAEAARGMMDKFEEVQEQIKTINDSLRGRESLEPVLRELRQRLRNAAHLIESALGIRE